MRETINAIINHPSVRPTAERGTHALDCGELLARPGVVSFTEGGKAGLFVPNGPDTWQGHIFCVAGERGRKALEFGEKCCRCMFRIGARSLEARAPRMFPEVAIYARRLGFRCVGRTADEIILRKEPA